ncbi:MAG: alpha-L-rhamnosidase C-terminal domain-containing protein [Opitutaceae bacterium]|nr:alpha-L-rhamnosidase C-terminal domain-containing protein [Opitutaceae bacterium]
MAHGQPGKNFGTAWTDAGIICPWTIWQVYGDTRVIERHWASMTRFMDWRQASTAPNGLGTSIGNPWGDWLNVDDPTSVEYVDTCYHALVCAQMAGMAAAIRRPAEAAMYRERFGRVQKAFATHYLEKDGRLKETSQTAHVLALQSGVLPPEQRAATATRLAEKIAATGHHMSTGFLGTRALLLSLSNHGQHDLAIRLFQTRKYPSWGYEVVNGATTVWERWDSFTTEHGFDGKNGKQNAAMNSFSHYAFGAVMEWAYRVLAGIDTTGAGYRHIVIRPQPPAAGSNPEVEPIHWVRAHYDSINGRITSAWRRANGRFELDVTVPANTMATVWLPARDVSAVAEGGASMAGTKGVREAKAENGAVRVEVGAGEYRFVVSEATVR